MDQPRTARDIMVGKLITVRPEADVFDGVRLLLRHGITGAPVVAADGGYLGMLSEKCCLSVLALTARAGGAGLAPVPARDFMASKLLTLRPENDAFEAIQILLKRRFSGAPVVDTEGRFLGVFSERYCMSLLVRAAVDQVPSSHVGAFTNADQGRLITEETDLLEVAQLFLDTHYRRLPVLRGDQLIGQVSRRDALRAEHHLAAILADPTSTLLEHRDELGDPISSDAVPTSVAAFMDKGAHTIQETTDLLAIAQIFLSTNRRRLPVLRQGRVVGQVSRRDLLGATLALMERVPHREQALLYLSAVMDRNQAPAF